MFKNRSASYIAFWCLGALILLARIVIPVLLVVNILSGKPSDDIERATIILLLADFGTPYPFAFNISQHQGLFQ